MPSGKIIIVLLLFISSACSQNENYPPIQDFDESSYELVKIIDGIDNLFHKISRNYHVEKRKKQ